MICLLVKAFSKLLLCLAVCELLFLEDFKSDGGSLRQITWENSRGHSVCPVAWAYPIYLERSAEDLFVRGATLTCWLSQQAKAKERKYLCPSAGTHK